MAMCEFPVSAPGLLHLSTLLIGTVCVTLGFMTHLHASWVSKQEYKNCQTTQHALRAMYDMSDTQCPDIALETAFLIITVICLCSSLLWYCCQCACCFGNSKTVGLFYVVYLAIAAGTLVIAGILYIKSAVMISNLSGPDYSSVVGNVGRVLIATIENEKLDEIRLTEQSDEQTYYQEKIITGVLSIINGVLHLMCGWLVVLDARG